MERLGAYGGAEPRNSEWGADKKDQLEFVLHKMVCAGEIPLADAQRAIATNWIDAWKRYMPGHQKFKFKPGIAE
ncbi:MAG: hypothetical protein PHY45_05920 [Rhodocyclaceae bacterium]|nr:hypothetical protein [Rhodocyclaceae bacterium]